MGGSSPVSTSTISVDSTSNWPCSPPFQPRPLICSLSHSSASPFHPVTHSSMPSVSFTSGTVCLHSPPPTLPIPLGHLPPRSSPGIPAIFHLHRCVASAEHRYRRLAEYAEALYRFSVPFFAAGDDAVVSYGCGVVLVSRLHCVGVGLFASPHRPVSASISLPTPFISASAQRYAQNDELDARPISGAPTLYKSRPRWGDCVDD